MNDSERTIEITDANFESVVASSGVPVLFDFWAEWCGPCKAVGPVVESLAGEFDDLARIGKLNVDENPDIARRFGIRSIPTVMLFDGGELRETAVGVRPQAELRALVEQYVTRH